MPKNRDMISLDGSPLSIEQVARVASCRSNVELQDAARARMQRARDEVEKIATGPEPVYGLNTGFGSLSKVRIEADHLEELQGFSVLALTS